MATIKTNTNEGECLITVVAFGIIFPREYLCSLDLIDSVGIFNNKLAIWYMSRSLINNS